MTNATLGRPARILLVEDDPADAGWMRSGFARSGVAVQITHVENGLECLRALRKEGKYAGTPTPDLIVLDLDMPVMDGRETLKQIVEDPELRRLPVVVLAGSSDEGDVLEMYKLRCNSYIAKPDDPERLQEVVAGIGRYWLTFVALADRK